MKSNRIRTNFALTLFQAISLVVIGGLFLVFPRPGAHAADSTNTPTPLLSKGHPVDWWFVFKFNSAVFPGCDNGATRVCLFGGDVQNYAAFGQQFVYASSEN